MEIGWLILFTFMLCEAAIVLLLVAPMPSNQVRGAIVTAITSVWEKSAPVRYIAIGLNVINAFYFWHVMDALLDPFAHFALVLYEMEPMLSCETRAFAFERERNAYITGMSLFLFLVLRRLVDIQVKLHESRLDSKAMSSGVPMGAPVGGGMGVPVQGKKVQ